MTSAPAPLARPGDVVRLAVEDYLYGDAPVTVRVVGIDAGLDRIPGLEWVRILAVDVAAPDGEPFTTVEPCAPAPVREWR
ncbi:hypothetical protein [Micromonospora sp. HM5-17]|uniref:hypothetical protein n=1 Tax=Micromonospora sp. HM5-17 TaxID=2487710 RepID=UPI000F49EC5C|nr:hypothetical protein [Micromonospora sp. HM5-17]ROT29365.1 hypothetical protein EF879_20525 [Micromonospora sp. HM5-17]